MNFEAIWGQVRALPGLVRYWQNHPIASQNVPAAFWRFLRWQIGSRALATTVIWPWVASTRLALSTGMSGGTMNVYCGLHEFNDMAFLLHFLREEDRFVDIGANLGAYTILASGVSKAQSLAVEPIASTFQRLRLNVAINEIHAKVQMEMCGVGPEQSSLTFIADQDTTNRVAPSGYKGRTTEVPVRTVDDLTNGFPAVLWKVDVEGFEEEVLAGARSALKEKTLVAVEMEGDSASIRTIMHAEGFQLFRYEPFSRTFSSGETASASGHNFLWIRDLEFVEKRCSTGPRIEVLGINF